MASIGNVTIEPNRSDGLSVSHNNNGNGPLVVLYVGEILFPHNPVITYDGEPLDKVAGSESDVGMFTFAFVLENPASGTNTLSVSGLSNTRHAVVVVSTNDCALTDPVESDFAHDEGEDVSNLILTTTEGGIVLSLSAVLLGAGLAPGTGQTLLGSGIFEYAPDRPEAGASVQPSEEGSTTAEWTWSSDTGHGHVALYLEGAGEPEPEIPDGHHYTISTPLS